MLWESKKKVFSVIKLLDICNFKRKPLSGLIITIKYQHSVIKFRNYYENSD